jgi:hypothetical protein
MGLFNRFLGKGERKEDGQMKLGPETDTCPEGKVQPIPVRNIKMVIICFLANEEKGILDETDKKLLTENYLQIFEEAWPDIYNAVVKGPGTPLKYGFVKSFSEAMEYAKYKQNELDANIVLQTKYPVLRHPTKGKCGYRIVLIIYLRADPAREKVVLLVAPNHRIVPDL